MKKRDGRGFDFVFFAAAFYLILALANIGDRLLQAGQTCQK